jgi:ribose 1,5-bisphosphate isomerase
MVCREVMKAYKDIRDFRIKGARNIAIAGIESLQHVKSMAELKKAAQMLSVIRPTEPMLRNGIKLVLKAADSSDLKHSIGTAVKQYDFICREALAKIKEVGARRIPADSNVFTMCHSSTAVAVFKAAWDSGKRFKMWVGETRPFYQGRITAAELANHGIPTTLIIDSAKGYFMHKFDLAIVGADALTADGYVVNKIGTSDLALLADEAGVQFGVAAELLKFDPTTIEGFLEPIEERSTKEVWDRPPKRVKIKNPIFDATPPKYVKFMITEAGVLTPYTIEQEIEQRYRWILD